MRVWRSDLGCKTDSWLEREVLCHYCINNKRQACIKAFWVLTIILSLWKASSEYAQFTLNWFLFYKRLHCSASYSNIYSFYSVRPNTISILFLFINGILNVARFQNCATLVDILKVQKQAVSRFSLFLERTLLFQ